MLANGVGHREETGRLAILARRAWSLVRECLFPQPTVRSLPPKPARPAVDYQPLRRILLTRGVADTFWQEYAEHRQGARGEEETGWVLLGHRERDEAVGLATLPAGTHRDAGVAHVKFDSRAQEVASRIVRQNDRRLTFLGVVHTHPGSLRQPSRGDFEGDRELVCELRGEEGVFGIGNAAERLSAASSKPNVQERGPLTFTWYSLAAGEPSYRPLPVELTEGPDLARPLRDVWPALEENAERIERLYRQQAGLQCKVIVQNTRPVLAVTVPLVEPGDSVMVMLERDAPQYLVSRGGDLFAVDPGATSIDRGVYLLLAELAARA